jgi:hypothetical protein
MRSVDDIIWVDDVFSCENTDEILLLQVAVNIMRNIPALSRHKKLFSTKPSLTHQIIQHCVDHFL